MADWSLLQSVSSSGTFCTDDNISTCLAILSQELQVQGFPPLPINIDGETNVVPLINALHAIQSRYRKHRGGREELEKKHNRLSGDLEHLKGTVVRLRRHLEQLNKELSEESEKLRQISNKFKLQSAKLKTEKEEAKRLNLVLKSRDIKFKHELKKNEQELTKLKERIHQLLCDKTFDRSTGLEMINVIQRSDGKRGTWNTRIGGRQEEEMYQGMLASYEEQHQELVCENTQLRECLFSMQKNLSFLRSSSNQTLSTEEEDEDEVEVRNAVDIDELSDKGYFQLPLEIIQRDIEKSFQYTFEKIKKNMYRPRNNLNALHVKPTASKQLILADVNTTVGAINCLPPVSSQQTDQHIYMSHLQQQATAYRDIIQKQEQLLHLQVKAREQENIERQQKLLDREKSEIEEKRIQYSLASADLDRQRQKIEEEKYLMLQQEFLCMSPFKKENVLPFKEETQLSLSPEIVSDTGISHVRLLPATPVYSPVKIPNKHKHSTDMLRARISSMFNSEYPTAKKKLTPEQSSTSQQSTSDISFLNMDGSSSSSLQNLTIEQLDILKQSFVLQSLSKSAKTENL